MGSGSRRGLGTVVVAGGGASGVLVAAGLLRCGLAVDVVVVEPRRQLGRGAAYSSPHPMHRLNAPAGEMSAHEQLPDHFVRWSGENGAALGRESFAQRGLYGRYLAAVLDEERRGAGRLGGLEHVTGHAVTAWQRPGPAPGLLVGLADGGRIEADTLILALGPPPTRPPWPDDGALATDRRVVADPWAAGALESLSARRVLLVGSGLTMVDVALSLRSSTEGPLVLHARSRHGLVPLAYGSAPIEPWAGRVEPASTARELVRGVRVAADKALLDVDDWRGVVARVRGDVPELWQGLEAGERRRLVRHGLRYWEVHRHRLAPEVARAFGDLVARGAIDVGRGRLRALEAAPSGLRALLAGAGGSELLEVDAVVNCTGPASSYRGVPLVDSLVDSGRAVPDDLGLGLRTDADGALVAASGAPLGGLYAVGWLRRGQLLESTAIPEIRRQVARLVERLAAGGR
jgi:uncharacterized NAD(P)/FAD-binding protein YdhS